MWVPSPVVASAAPLVFYAATAAQSSTCVVSSSPSCCGPLVVCPLLAACGLELVEEAVEGGDGGVEALALPDAEHHVVDLGAGLQGVAAERLPVVEDTLGEGLAARVGAQVGREAEGLEHRQVGLEGHHGRARALLLRLHDTTAAGQHAVAATNGVLGHRDLAQVHGLLHTCCAQPTHKHKTDA